MKEDLFEELRQSVREGGAILRARRKASRAFQVGEPDVRAVREGYRLSQTRFAALMGISAGTLRNWEQGRRKPEGSARILLRIVARHPEAVLDVVSSRKRAKPAAAADSRCALDADPQVVRPCSSNRPAHFPVRRSVAHQL